MRCVILSAAGLAGLLVGLIVSADDDPSRAPAAAPGAKAGALRRKGQPGPGLLPTQVWWTDREGDFQVYLSGSKSDLEADSWKRQINARELSGFARGCD